MRWTTAMWRLDVPDARTLLAASMLFSVATAIVLRQQLVAFTSVPDRGDPLFSMWRIAWVAHQLPLAPRHLFDANIFHPAARTLAYQTRCCCRRSSARPRCGWACRSRSFTHACCCSRMSPPVSRCSCWSTALHATPALHRSPASCSRSTRSVCCTTRIWSCSSRSGCRSRCSFFSARSRRRIGETAFSQACSSACRRSAR